MKLMFYINTISHGGAERVISRLATEFSERGDDVTLVTSFRTPDFEYDYGSKVCRISLSECRVKNPLVRNPVYIFRLRRLVKKNQPDVLISFMPEANYRAIIACLGTKSKSIISVRNDPNREYRAISKKIAAKLLYRNADGVVFQTEDAQHWFPKPIQDKSRIIFNQVDSRFYETSYEGERHDVVATGRLVPQKNHRMLIDAWADIAGRTTENLLVYGVGRLENILQSQIEAYHMEDRVHLKGNSKDVPNDIKGAKIYVMSSDFEGMPNALMEAMALGLPCISTDCPCGGPRMLFGDELKECLVTVGNAEEMAQKILGLLNNEAERERIGELCKQRAQMFRPEIIIENWNQYIKEIIAQ